MTWYDIPLTDAYVRGAEWLEPTDRGAQPHRLPAWALRQAADAQISMMEVRPSGVRIAFRTAACAVEVTAHRSRIAYGGVPSLPDGVVVATVDGGVVGEAATSGGTTTTIDMATGAPSVNVSGAFTASFALPVDARAGMRTVELWLPHNEAIELHAVRADAPVEPVADGRRRWVHHGSSISHGSNATLPTDIWPVAAARIADVDLRNLGFGGSALLDPFMARTIRDTSADLISLKLGINLTNLDLMRMRGFRPAVHGFLDTVRDGHPTTPLLVISPILAPIHEVTPGPGSFDLAALAAGRLQFAATGDPAEVRAGKLTLETIRAELARIVAERRTDDPNLHHLDGRELYGEADAERLPLPDRLHPDAETHRLMGRRFAELAFTDGPFRS